MRHERPVTVDQVAEHFTAELAAGQMPSKRQIQTGMHVGQRTAKRLHEELAVR